MESINLADLELHWQQSKKIMKFKENWKLNDSLTSSDQMRE